MGGSSGNNNGSAGGLKGADGKTASQRQSDGNAGRGTGLTTGKTMYGNTAYGPAGGKAVGYASVSPNSKTTGTGNRQGVSSGYGNLSKGGGFAQNNYSNFRNTDGSAKFNSGPGAPGGKGVYANGGMRAQALAQKMSSPYVKPAGMTGYKKPEPAVVRRAKPKAPVRATKPAGPKIKSIPETAFMYPFEGPNFQNRRIGEVRGNQAPKQFNDRVPTEGGQLRWNSTGIGGYPSKNINKDQSQVPKMAKGGSVPGKPIKGTKRCK